jgi:hypothetical protein
MGLPEGSIRNKATQDGCTDEVMDYFFKNCTGGGSGAAPSPAPAPTPAPAPAPAPAATQVRTCSFASRLFFMLVFYIVFVTAGSSRPSWLRGLFREIPQDAQDGPS